MTLGQNHVGNTIEKWIEHNCRQMDEQGDSYIIVYTPNLCLQGEGVTDWSTYMFKNQD